MSSERETFIAKCNAHGEKGVREYIRLGKFNPDRTAWAKQWLEDKAQERVAASEARRDASQAEQIDIARSAKDAAWAAAEAARDAAREAKKANVIATLALIAALPAIAISIIALFLRS